MKAAFVVDCSIAMAWLFGDEATPQTSRILERLATESALVPGWWYLELANVIAVAERRGRIAPQQTAEFLVELSKLDIEADLAAPEQFLGDLLPLCRQHQLTSYDALYLDLAVRRGLPLATLDGPLRAAAKKLGVKLLGT